MLNQYEIEELVDQVVDIITQQILLANRTGSLNELLDKYGFNEFIKNNSAYDTEKDGKIVVIGQSEINKNILCGIVKSLGLSRDRFEFCLDYNESKTYNYKNMQYNPKYRVVLFGPVPHSTIGKSDSGSVIAEMQQKEGYPRVVILNSNNALKITKSGFKKALENLIAENYI